MGELMINCPKTGKPVSTGIYIGREKLGAMPVFFSSLFCPSCGSSHEWFARDAWVCDSDSGICDRRPPSAEGSLARDIATLKGEPVTAAPEPRPASKTVNSHDHVEVVAVHRRQVGHRHAARSADGIRICPSASTLYNHGRVADRAPYKIALAFFSRHICGHVSTLSVRDCAAHATFLRLSKRTPSITCHDPLIRGFRKQSSQRIHCPDNVPKLPRRAPYCVHLRFVLDKPPPKSLRRNEWPDQDRESHFRLSSVGPCGVQETRPACGLAPNLRVGFLNSNQPSWLAERLRRTACIRFLRSRYG